METVFVVIPSWNLKDDLITCIDSLLTTSNPLVSIMVVDDASTDGTVEALRQRFATEVTILVNDKQVGFAQAVNQGVIAALSAGAEYILIINNDTVVDNQMINHLIQALHFNPAAGIVSPFIYYHDQPKQLWGSGTRQWIGPIITKPVQDNAQSNAPCRVDYVTGCAMLIKRVVFEQVGFLDEDYIMYFEDADFCQRVRQTGFEIMVVPQAKMWHKVSLSTRQLVPKRLFSQSRGRVIFLNRHSSRPYLLLANSYIWGQVIRVGVKALRQGQRHIFLAALKGTLVGYRFLWDTRS